VRGARKEPRERLTEGGGRNVPPLQKCREEAWVWWGQATRKATHRVTRRVASLRVPRANEKTFKQFSMQRRTASNIFKSPANVKGRWLVSAFVRPATFLCLH
jgi:hypothetical protein